MDEIKGEIGDEIKEMEDEERIEIDNIVIFEKIEIRCKDERREVKKGRNEEIKLEFNLDGRERI